MPRIKQVTLLGLLGLVVGLPLGFLAMMGVNGVLPAGAPYLGLLAGVIVALAAGWSTFVIGLTIFVVRRSI